MNHPLESPEVRDAYFNYSMDDRLRHFVSAFSKHAPVDASDRRSHLTDVAAAEPGQPHDGERRRDGEQPEKRRGDTLADQDLWHVGERRDVMDRLADLLQFPGKLDEQEHYQRGKAHGRAELGQQTEQCCPMWRAR